MPAPINLKGGSWLGLATAAFALTGCDEGECYPPTEWSQPGELWRDGGPALPVDAAPWLLRHCTYYEQPTGDCALIADGLRIPVDVEQVGRCDIDFDSRLDQGTPHVIQTLRPSQPLPPGATLALECTDDDDDPYAGYYNQGNDSYEPDAPLTLQIRTSNIPSAPPGELTDLAIHYTRSDPNTCGPEGDYLALTLDFDAPFLREGGHIEAQYPNGQVFSVVGPTEDGVAWLPGTRGPLLLTPVAIDGQRGEPIQIDEGDMTSDRVYIPGCSVAPLKNPSLLALLWLASIRRRRSS